MSANQAGDMLNIESLELRSRFSAAFSHVLDAAPGRTSLVALIAVGLLISPPVAGAQHVIAGCIEDSYNDYGPGGTVNCTANDVSLVDVLSLTVDPGDDGCAFVGDTITFDAEFLVQVNAQQRQDIGIYLSTDGGDAITGTCAVDVLTIGDAGVVDLDGTLDDTSGNNSFGYCSPDAGSSLANPVQPCNEDSDCTGAETCEEFGPGIQDVCGDMDKANAGTCSISRTSCAIDANCPGTESCELGTAISDVEDVTILCLDDDNDGFADISYSASWRIAGANELCLSPLAAFPGNTSKCRGGVPNALIPISTQTLDVIKSLSPISDPGLFDLEVDAVVQKADASDGDSTGPVGVSPGNHTVSESAGTGSVLSNYTSDISCVETVGSCVANPGIACLNDMACDSVSAGDTCDLTPVTVASCTGCTSLTVPVPGGQSAIQCTITNSNHCAGVDCSGLDDSCNVGQCNPSTGACETAPRADGTSCDDANACTTGDVCGSGTCVGGAPPNCDDGNTCTDDSCNPATGCVATNNTAPCDDGNACTTTDVCGGGLCVGGAPPNCDDSNVCTDDSCNPATGCVNDQQHRVL